VTDTNGYSGYFNETASGAAQIFTSGGTAGAHYLPAHSPYLTGGNPLGIPVYVGDLQLGAELSGTFRGAPPLTCRAPAILTGTVSTTTLVGPRFVPGALANALGYHYWTLDYCWSGLEVSNATLLLTNGVAVGHFGSQGTKLLANGKLVSEGRPAGDLSQPNKLVRYTAVQEGGGAPWGGAVGAFRLVSFNGPGEVFLRFTEVAVPADIGARRRLIGEGPFAGTVALRDCRLWNVFLDLYNTSWSQTPRLNLTNNIFERCYLALEQGYAGSGYPVYFELWNNLLRLGTFSVVTYHNAYYGTWNIRDNLFDKASVAAYVVDPDNCPLPSSHNGFISSSQLPGPGNKPNLSADFTEGGTQAGDSYLGPYYYARNGSLWNNLVDQGYDSGGRTAGTAGLYQYTVDPVVAVDDPATPGIDERQNRKERTTRTDIGFHYPVPLDTDHASKYEYYNGLDWQEDRNGNGQADSGETDWQDPDSDNDYLMYGDEIAFGLIPTSAHSDNDGLSDYVELLEGSNPVDTGNTLPPTRLCRWPLNDASLLGIIDPTLQVAPLDASAGLLADSFEGSAVQFPAADTKVLTYPLVHEGHKTIDLRHGAVRFWYLPQWPTGLPGARCTLLEVSSPSDPAIWRLSVDPNGRDLVFESPGVIENVRKPLPTEGRILSDGKTAWEITLCYTAGSTWLQIDSLKTFPDAKGLGVIGVPSAGDLRLRIGSSIGGANPAQGRIDALETFSAPVGTEADPNNPIYFISPFRKLWEGGERRSQLLTATAGQNQLELRWVGGFEGDLAVPDNYKIERRPMGQSAWTTLATGVRADRYTDANPPPASQVCQYRVSRQGHWLTNAAAVALAPRHQRGRALLLVDSTLAGDLATELGQFAQDLTADGWYVALDTTMPRHADFDPAKGYTLQGYQADLAYVKDSVVLEWDTAPVDPQTGEKQLAVILIGHVTIPYSGNAHEDGHYFPPSHQGAWPADIYYGDMDGVWTDATVNHTAPQPLLNVPNDGKWDQNEFPADAQGKVDLEVPIGRLDFAYMPAFGSAPYVQQYFPPGTPTPPPNRAVELALIKHYFSKARRYRSKYALGEVNYAPTQTWRCFVSDDNFHWLVESLRSVSSRLDGQIDIDYWFDATTKLSTLRNDVFRPRSWYGNQTYLFGIHGGYGSATHISTSLGVRRSDELDDPQNEPKVLFHLLAASWLGDWMWGAPSSAPEDRFMTACLSTEDYGLAAMWSYNNQPVSGPWRMDRLALGYHLGTALQDTIRHNAKQSCRTLFILGDPTLTGFVVAPPGTPGASGGTAPCDGNGRWVYLSWPASPEPVDGYYVYRGTSLESAIQNGRLFPGHITTTSYEDCAPGGETYIYAVRAVKLTQSGAGSFYNLSRAASVTFTVSP